MMKRPFLALRRPGLTYTAVTPDPGMPAVIPVPDRLTLMVTESIVPARPLPIQAGDPVARGTRLALYPDSTACAASPVPGTIEAITAATDAQGRPATVITIRHKTDGTLPALKATSPEDLTFAAFHLNHLPGAPPFSLLADPETKIRTVVIACADADLMTTTRQYIAAAWPEELTEGVGILKKMIPSLRICAALPEGMPDIPGFSGIQIFRTGTAYPASLPAMILKDHLKSPLPAGKTPEQTGVCFVSPEALISIARTFRKKTPVFEKVITVIDSQFRQFRVSAVIGTPLSDIFRCCSITLRDQDRVIIGGPLQGYAVFDPHHPVLLDLDTVIIQSAEQISPVSDKACVNCGRCVQICPAHVPVNLLVRHLEKDMFEEAVDLCDLNSCIECGLCAWVCLSRIPLFHYIRLGKKQVMTQGA
jgi:Na+-translocating ferredoxin:NAD+ oxidoreductase subunit C